MNDQHLLSLEQVAELTREALSAHGARGDQLDIATRSVVDAECDGIRAVGLNYLPVYCGHLDHKKLSGDAIPSHQQIAPSAIQSYAANGFAHTAYVEAEQDFYRLAESQGIAALTIVDSYSAGVVGWFVDRMAAQGLIGLGFANSPSLVSPAPGAGRFFGTNPMAFAIPRTGKPAVVADMATSQVAYVTIKQYAAEGKTIPENWGYDADGRPSTDPDAVVNGGSLAPVGGYKGTLLALLVDVLAGALAGPNCSFNAPAFGNNQGTYPAVGQFFLAISPCRLGNGGFEPFAARLEAMLSALAAEPGVRLPGDRRQQSRERARKEGVRVPDALLKKLKGLAGGC